MVLDNFLGEESFDKGEDFNDVFCEVAVLPGKLQISKARMLVSSLLIINENYCTEFLFLLYFRLTYSILV